MKSFRVEDKNFYQAILPILEQCFEVVNHPDRYHRTGAAHSSGTTDRGCKDQSADHAYRHPFRFHGNTECPGRVISCPCAWP